MTKGEILAEIRDHAQKWHPGIVVGFDLKLTSSMAEDVACVLEVFNLPAEMGREFFRVMFRPLRDAERKLGSPITVVTHDPDASRKYYAEAMAECIAKAGTVYSSKPEWIFDGLPTGRLADLAPRDDSPLLRAA